MMKPLDNKLVLLGSHIDAVRRQLKITQELLCAEVACSKSTYRKV